VQPDGAIDATTGTGASADAPGLGDGTNLGTEAGTDGEAISDAEAGLPQCTLEADGGCSADPATGVCCPLLAWRYDEAGHCLRPYAGTHMTFACEAEFEGCGGSPATGCYTHTLEDGGSEIIVAPSFFDRSVVDQYQLIPCEAGNYASAAACP
jgi:hypothetical protein